MSTPTVIATLRANLKAAVAAVFADPAVKSASGLTPIILEGKTAEAWFLMNLPGGEGIVIAYAPKQLKSRGPEGKRRNRLCQRFSIALCSGNWAEPVGATYTAADLGEYLMGSPTLPPETTNLNDTKIGSINGDDIYIRYLSEEVKMAPNSTFEGGRSAIVTLWETDPAVPQ